MLAVYKPRCVYAYNALSRMKLSASEREERLEQIELWRDNGFVCGDACPVEAFETKQSIRCGDYVESQYYTFAKNTKKKEDEGEGESEDEDEGKTLNVKICCFCCNDDELVSTERIMEKHTYNGHVPLPLCEFCFGLNIKPPAVKAATNFFEKRGRRKGQRRSARGTQQ